MNKHILDALEIAAHKAQYNAEAKNILANKRILAWILKHCAVEFKDMAISEIVSCIDGEPEISSIPVSPGRQSEIPEKITGLVTEDIIPNEGQVTYDIRFSVRIPLKEKKETIKLLINIEAQKKYYPGYDLVTRCIFYLARQISAQLDTEFTADNYDNIKKVYSIWICMDTPKYAQNTITKYEIQKTPLVGNFNGKARYDLMTGVMICLSDEINPDSGSLLRLLEVLFSETLTPVEKSSILEKEYDIETSAPEKEGVNRMCNLADLIEERGIEKGIKQGIEQGIEKGIELTRIEMIQNMYKSGLTLEKISEIATMPVDKLKEILEL